jgi:hypothetical protein
VVDFLGFFSLLLVIVAAAFPLVVISGGGDANELNTEYDRERHFNTGSAARRAMYRATYWVSAQRPLVGAIGILGLVAYFVLR